MSQKSRVLPPREAFRRRIKEWFDSFERLNVSRWQADEFSKWRERFIQGEGLKDLWAVNVERRGVKRGRKHVPAIVCHAQPEQVLESLAGDKLAFFDLPKELKTKQELLPEDLKAVLKLTGRKERARTAARLDRTATLIEKYGPTLKLFNVETDFGSKELANLVRNYARKISELPSSRGRRPEVFLRLAGVELMRCLTNGFKKNKSGLPWALAGRLMHATFAPNPWTAGYKTSGKALKKLIKDDLIALEKDMLCQKYARGKAITIADPGQVGPR